MYFSSINPFLICNTTKTFYRYCSQLLHGHKASCLHPCTLKQTPGSVQVITNYSNKLPEVMTKPLCGGDSRAHCHLLNLNFKLTEPWLSLKSLCIYFLIYTLHMVLPFLWHFSFCSSSSEFSVKFITVLKILFLTAYITLIPLPISLFIKVLFIKFAYSQ